MSHPLAGALGTVALLAAALPLVFTSPTVDGFHGAATGVELRVPQPAQEIPAQQAATTLSTMQARPAGSRLRMTTPRRAVAGSRFTVRGTAPAGRPGRKMVLSFKSPTGWKTSALTRADRRGDFQFKIAAPASAGQSAWKVTAQRFGTRRTQSATFRVTITPRRQSDTPTDAPLGSGSDWTYISAGKSMRWDPCTPILWHYASERQAYPAASRDLTQALALLSQQSGLTFTRVSDKPKAMLSIRWATPSQEPMLGGSTVGVGGPSYRSIDPARNQGTQAVIVSGTVTFDATETGRPGFTNSDGWTWGQVFVHEVMHAMGLGHANGPTQVMFPRASTTNQRFGAGDINGLTTVGTAKGCIDTGYSMNPRPRTAVVLTE